MPGSVSSTTRVVLSAPVKGSPRRLSFPRQPQRELLLLLFMEQEPEVQGRLYTCPGRGA